jgi:hypothetical protein
MISTHHSNNNVTISVLTYVPGLCYAHVQIYYNGNLSLISILRCFINTILDNHEARNKSSDYLALIINTTKSYSSIKKLESPLEHPYLGE